jgi:RNA polymerase sigma factor (TIGR02999 family)
VQVPVSTPLDQIELTRLLNAWRAGDAESEDALMRAVYPVLRDIARARLRRVPGDFTLQATELVNEAYARIVQGKGTDWTGRVHFFAVAARVIRNVVVDHMRSGETEKRGGDLPFVPLDAVTEDVAESTIDLRVDWLAVHGALDELETKDPKSARIVELKFFSGLTTDEIAEVVQISRASVVREWRFARAWLANRLA